MAAHAERFISPQAGNGLRAVREIKAGAPIQIREIKGADGGDVTSCAPFAFCVARNFLQSACHNCVCTSVKLLRCSQCKTARYCSIQCQKEAWSEHKSECSCLKRIHPRIPTDSVRLAARIIFRLMSAPHADAGELYSLAEHQTHLEDMSDEQREGLVHLCSTLKLYLGEENILPNGLNPITLLAQVTCNCFSISNGELQDIGVGLYPSMSLLNHDCRPNCVMVFLGKRLQLRAVRNITANEELTISYTEVLAPRVERRTQLQTQYHFLCLCQRCNTQDMDSEMLVGDEADWTILRDKLPELVKLQTENRWEELLNRSETLLSRHADALPDSNIYLLRLLDLVLDACVSLDQYEKALEYGKRTLGPYQQYYPDPHPCRAVELLRVGKLQHYLGKLEDAQSNFRQAYEVMKVTHGPGHPLMTEVQRKLEECGAELRSHSS